MSRKSYFVKRTVQTVFMLWLILTLLFFLFRLMPGSYLDIMVFGGASEEYVRQFKIRWGLNDPLYIQYLNYLWNFLQLDVGESIQYRQPVWGYVRMKIFNTMILALPGITVAYVIGSVLGTMIGNVRETVYEKAGIVAMIVFGSFPEFFVAIAAILVFSMWLNIFPASGMLSPGFESQFADAPWWRPYLTTDFAIHYILPFSTIVFRQLMAPGIIMRTSVVEVMGQDFIFYHEITGLPYVKRLTHIGKHAILPVITVYPISLTRAISGLVLIELVFNWPGIGFALVQAVLSRDFPVVQFVFFLTAAVVVVGNFVVDILYGIIDPRIDIEGSR